MLWQLTSTLALKPATPLPSLPVQKRKRGAKPPVSSPFHLFTSSSFTPAVVPVPATALVTAGSMSGLVRRLAPSKLADLADRLVSATMASMAARPASEVRPSAAGPVEATLSSSLYFPESDSKQALACWCDLSDQLVSEYAALTCQNTAM